MWISSAEVCAVNYYVDGTNGNDGNPGTINQPWQTINKANSTLQAGDTVHIRGGTYSGQQIKPSNSGTAGNYITYQSYGEEEAIVGEIVITGSRFRRVGYFLENVNYIKIDGIRFANIGSYFGELKNAEYCIIQNCEFYNSRSYGGTRVGYSSNYNKFLNNTFEDAPVNYDFKKTNCKSLPYGPECDCDTAPADFLCIYSGKGNIIENNTFGDASHGSISIESRDHDPWGDSISTLTVVRNNNFNNKLHSSCGGGTQRILIENNRIYGAGSRCDKNPVKHSRNRGFSGGHGGIYVLDHDSIVRYNVVVNSGWGLYYGATGGKYISGNLKIYSNTFYANAYHIQQSGNSGANYNNTTIINNVFYKAQYHEWSDYADLPGDENYFINNSFTPNAANFYFKNTNKTARTLDEIKSLYPTEWHSSNFSADPKFTNAGSRDFTLKSNSPMIDKGMFLTTITSPTANSQTSFRVADAIYFYDGWGIPGEVGDTIKTKNGQITIIQSIDYDTNTITVNPAINIIKNEGIALNYSGSAPDIGAFEFGESIK